MPVQKHVPLQALHTFGVDIHTNYYSLINDPALLQELLNNKLLKPLRKIVIGSGSNVLFVKDFEGWVIHMAINEIKKIQEDNKTLLLRVGGGVLWHNLVLYCIERSYAGIENLSLIPGTVGAASIQNIGAYGVEFSEVLEYLEVLEIKTGIIKKFTKEDCAFEYRDSIFKNSFKDAYIILFAAIRLQKQPTFRTSYGAIEETLNKMEVKEMSIKAISDAIIHIRKQKLPDPKFIGNAGSFFKNPIIKRNQLAELISKYPDLPTFATKNEEVKISAAWLVEQCGWKGYKNNQVGVHPNQALVLVNYGRATGQEVYDLAQEIQRSVKKKFDILLEAEVNIIN